MQWVFFLAFSAAGCLSLKSILLLWSLLLTMSFISCGWYFSPLSSFCLWHNFVSFKLLISLLCVQFCSAFLGLAEFSSQLYLATYLHVFFFSFTLNLSIKHPFSFFRASSSDFLILPSISWSRISWDLWSFYSSVILLLNSSALTWWLIYFRHSCLLFVFNSCLFFSLFQTPLLKSLSNLASEQNTVHISSISLHDLHLSQLFFLEIIYIFYYS